MSRLNYVAKCLWAYLRSIAGVFIHQLDSKLYLVQPSIVNPFSCFWLLITPTRNERFMVSITIAIKGAIAILVSCENILMGIGKPQKFFSFYSDLVIYQNRRVLIKSVLKNFKATVSVAYLVGVIRICRDV